MNKPNQFTTVPKMILIIALITLGALAATSAFTQVQVTDINIKFIAEIQDVGPGSNLPFANVSHVFMSDSTSHQASESDSIEWKWFRYERVEQEWIPVFVDSTFNLYPGDHLEMCSGIQLIKLEATTPEGRKFARIEPAKVLFTNPITQCEGLVTPFSIGSYQWNDDKFLLNSYQNMNLADPAHVTGKYLIRNMADLNGDGHVNVVDLLLFTSQYGL